MQYLYKNIKCFSYRPTSVSNEILAVIAVRFFKTEIDPVFHLHGIISKGWISSQQVEPKYFKLLGIL